MNLKKCLIRSLPIFCFCTLVSYSQNILVNELCKGSFESAENTVVYQEPFISRKVEGSILNILSKGVDDTTVVITDKDYKQVISYVKTNAKGFFSFKIKKKSEYYLLICKPGFNPQRLVIKLVRNFKKTPKIALTLTPV